MCISIIIPRYETTVNKKQIPEAKLVHRHRQMPGLIIALVEVAVIHWNEVNVAEDKTIIVILLQSFCVTNVEELGTIEYLLSPLPLSKDMIPRDDEDKLQNTHLMQIKSHLRERWNVIKCQ